MVYEEGSREVLEGTSSKTPHYRRGRNTLYGIMKVLQKCAFSFEVILDVLRDVKSPSSINSSRASTTVAAYTKL